MTPETLLSELVAETRPEDLSQDALRASARQVYDAIGVTLAAAAQPAGRAIVRVAADAGGTPDAQVIGSPLRTSTIMAAWANGSMAHLLDFDDAGFSHPTACIYPAALAVGELQDASGPDFLLAMTVAYEVFERLSASARRNEPAVRMRGFHPTSIYGSVAAAAAASSLLRLGPEAVRVAFGIAATDASGLTQQFGTWSKGLTAGNAARSGVHAALLARAGYEGDEQAISGAYGLFNAVHGQGTFDFGGVGVELGKSWAIVEPGLSIKLYPACGLVRRPVDAMLSIASTPGYEAGAVARIAVDVHPHVFHTLRYRAPTRGFQGKFSLDYSVASAALDQRLGIESFSDAMATRPELREMLARVELREHPEWDISTYREMAIEVTMKDGAMHRVAPSTARGTPEDPLTKGQLEAKFLDCAAWVLRDSDARTLSASLARLPDLRSIRDLAGLVRPLETADS